MQRWHSSECRSRYAGNLSSSIRRYRPQASLTARFWKKFGGPEALAGIWAHVSTAGQRAGIDLAFDRIELRANTLAAHRLIHRFQTKGLDTDTLAERIFMAGFCDGRNIGSTAELAATTASRRSPGCRARPEQKQC